jgi:hypothetical protein
MSAPTLCVITAAGIPLTVIDPAHLARHDLSRFQALAILGGNSGDPVVLEPRARIGVEETLGPDCGGAHVG